MAINPLTTYGSFLCYLPPSPLQVGGRSGTTSGGGSCQEIKAESAREFLDKGEDDLDEVLAQKGELERKISSRGLLTRRPKKGKKSVAIPRWARRLAAKTVQDATSGVGEADIILWLFNRAKGSVGKNGAPESPPDLARALTALRSGSDTWAQGRREHWPAQLAMILSSELEDPKNIILLEKVLQLALDLSKTMLKPDDPLWKWKTETEPRRREQLALQMINTVILKDQNIFSLLQGENFFRRALLAKSLGDIALYNLLLKKAWERVSRLDAKTEDIGAFTQRTLPKKYQDYIPQLAQNDQEELRKHFAWANLLLGNILTLEAAELDDEKQKLAKLEEAVPYLKKTSPLEGFPLLEARKILADDLTLQGYIRKNLNQEYLGLFSNAVCNLDYVRSWEENYRREIGPKGIVPRWLVNISTSARVSKLKLLSVAAGDIHRQTDAPVVNLLTEVLEPRDLASLINPAPLSKIGTLELQERVLKKIAEELGKADKVKYTYKRSTGNIDVPVVQYEGLKDLEMALAEIDVRLAFTAKDLGESKIFSDERLTAAENTIEEILKKDSWAALQTRGNANLWKAKIITVKVGDLGTLEEIVKKMEEAKTCIAAALATGKLTGSLLSSAHQTLGEALLGQRDLVGARREFARALGIDEAPEKQKFDALPPIRNYDALASLADVLSQQAEYDDALKAYGLITKYLPQRLIVERAELGAMEVRLRQGEVYSPKSIQELEKMALRLFTEEPSGSFLVPRAIDDLIESSSTDEHLHDRIIFIGNKLLGTNYRTSPDRLGGIEPALAKLGGGRIIEKLGLKPRFRLQILLKLAEALLWRKDYNDAAYLSDKVNPDKPVPSSNGLSVLKRIAGADFKINLAYRLLRAELQMRKEKDAREMLDLGLKRDLEKGDDPDLRERGINGSLEAYTSVLKDFGKTIKCAEKYLGEDELKKVEALFLQKGRRLSFLKYRLKLKKKYADALGWDKEYEASRQELDALAAQVVANKALLPAPLEKLFNAQILVGRGEIDTYDWPGQKFADAESNFQAVLALYPDTVELTQNALVVIAQAHIGLAEVYRYGEDDDKDFRDPVKSRKHYLEAERLAKTLPERSDDRARLLGRAYFGLFGLEEYLGNSRASVDYLLEALKYEEFVPPATRLQMRRAYKKYAAKTEPSVNSGWKGAIGSEGRLESQVSAEFEYPIPGAEWLHFTTEGRINTAPNVTLWSLYPGAKLVTDNFSLGFKAKPPFWTACSGSACAGDPFNEFRFTIIPDVETSAYLGTKSFSFLIAASLDAYDPARSTFHADAAVNLGVAADWLEGLGPVVSYDHFSFTTLDPSGNRYWARRNQLGFGAKLEKDATDWLRVGAAAKFLIYDPPSLPPGTTETEPKPWGVGMEVGLNAAVIAAPWLAFELANNLSYSPEYTTYTPSFAVNFVIPDGRNKPKAPPYSPVELPEERGAVPSQPKPAKKVRPAGEPRPAPVRSSSVSAPTPAAAQKTSADLNNIQEARNAYLALFGQQLPKGTIIIKKPDSDATSEGIGFAGQIFALSGGLAAAGLALSAGNSAKDQAAFWQIYQARNAYFVKSNGVMAWSLNSNGTINRKNNGADSASDGDQDWIAAELATLEKLAGNLWQLPAGITMDEFKARIKADLKAFWDNHVKLTNGRLVFLSTDGAWAKRGDGREIYYPNYADPHFLRMFARFDSARAWAKLAEDVQALNQAILDDHGRLGAKGQNPMPAKVFVQVAADGKYVVENYYERSKREGVGGAAVIDNEADAIRFLLRQARSARLDNDRAAIKMLAQLTAIANVTDVSSVHLYAGDSKASHPLGYNNTLARAAYGLALYASGKTAKAAAFLRSVMNDHRGQFFGEWDGARNYYYDQSLILQILDLWE